MQCLKVLSYWNLNLCVWIGCAWCAWLKVLSYWNLNGSIKEMLLELKDLKYYHIGI